MNRRQKNFKLNSIEITGVSVGQEESSRKKQQSKVWFLKSSQVGECMHSYPRGPKDTSSKNIQIKRLPDIF